MTLQEALPSILPLLGLQLVPIAVGLWDLTVLAAGMVAAGIAGHAYTTILFEAPSIAGWAAMCALLLLQMSAYAAVTFLGSTLTRSPLAAAGIGVGALTVIAIAGALPGLGAWTPSGLADAGMAIANGAEPDELLRPVVATAAVIAAALAASCPLVPTPGAVIRER